MNPSQLTDDELRLAIAKVIAEADESGCILGQDREGNPQYWYGKERFQTVPNYPGDIEAAMGLYNKLNYHEQHRFAEFIYETTEIGLTDTTEEAIVILFNNLASKSGARFLSEAWLTARRNNV